MSAAAVNETVLLAIITALTGLGGAFLGAFVSMRIERQRQKQQQYGISAAIRMDTVRWVGACVLMANKWQIAAHLGRGLNWVSIASIATVHLPPGLSMLLFHLYSQREETEAAYEAMTKRMDNPKRMFEMRYALRRWSVMAEEVVREWDRYNGRSLWRRILARWLWTDLLDRKGVAAEDQTLQRIHLAAAHLLSQRYGYSVGENGQLLPENHTQEAYARMQEEMSAAQRRNNPGR